MPKLVPGNLKNAVLRGAVGAIALAIAIPFALISTCYMTAVLHHTELAEGLSYCKSLEGLFLFLVPTFSVIVFAIEFLNVMLWQSNNYFRLMNASISRSGFSVKRYVTHIVICVVTGCIVGFILPYLPCYLATILSSAFSFDDSFSYCDLVQYRSYSSIFVGAFFLLLALVAPFEDELKT